MTGKTITEKRKLLKDLEEHNQDNLQMKFQMERQQMLHDEKWAMRAMDDYEN